ncbi:15.4 kDa class V heat shock protein-like [Zingiber officinale]|uniref:15.4 kDa class V heat shock protein-like n=1 Tax=Zingiber officinale TaxID=94328 RepID=UPI001C4CDF4C|nr:15.4 kDa class V heat shock protein-like [Zingiber officinale]
MEAYYYYPLRSSRWPFFPASYSLFSQRSAAVLRQNYIRWDETQDSHLFTAQLAGLRKEDIRVEVEDSKYMIIRTERAVIDDDGDEHRPEFIRKFRLPETVDVEGIVAKYEDGVLTVTVPRSMSLGRIRIRPDDAADGRNAVARAA